MSVILKWTRCLTWTSQYKRIRSIVTTIFRSEWALCVSSSWTYVVHRHELNSFLSHIISWPCLEIVGVKYILPNPFRKWLGIDVRSAKITHHLLVNGYVQIVISAQISSPSVLFCARMGSAHAIY